MTRTCKAFKIAEIFVFIIIYFSISHEKKVAKLRIPKEDTLQQRMTRNNEEILPANLVKTH